MVQREDYSDIEKKATNYANAMTDLDKEWLFIKPQVPENTLTKMTLNVSDTNKPTIVMKPLNKPSQKVKMGI